MFGEAFRVTTRHKLNNSNMQCRRKGNDQEPIQSNSTNTDDRTMYNKTQSAIKEDNAFQAEDHKQVER